MTGTPYIIARSKSPILCVTIAASHSIATSGEKVVQELVDLVAVECGNHALTLEDGFVLKR
jgi:hypothetical protein